MHEMERAVWLLVSSNYVLSHFPNVSFSFKFGGCGGRSVLFCFGLQKVALLDTKTTKLIKVRFPCCRTFKESIIGGYKVEYFPNVFDHRTFFLQHESLQNYCLPPKKERKDDVTDFKMRLFLPQIQLKSQRAYTKVQLRTINSL